MKGGEEAAEKGENFGEKLRRLGKGGGQTTPVASFWRLEELKLLLEPAPRMPDSGDYKIQQNPSQIPCVSARKLAATLWELHQYKLQLHRIHHGSGGPHPRLRRLNHDKNAPEPFDPSPASLDQPESSSSLRRHAAASLMQHHRSNERNSRALQPASYGSSMELAPYNPALTPTSSVELRERTGAASYGLRTSTELLKVFNRIWILEEQHVSNMSLVKTLKKELNHARSQINALVREQQADRCELDALMEQIAEDEVVRKNKEQERVNSALQSMMDELEDEKKLRKRSESLHRNLARELFDMKTAHAKISKELENKKRSHVLLEDMCDEFALAIRGYEKEMHALRQKSDKDWTARADDDQLILHLSETWLDERMQMKLQNGHGIGGETKSVVDKLSAEIEAFLYAKRMSSTNNHVAKNPTVRSSLESIPLNMAVSAPQDEDDSAGSDSNCFELEKMIVSTRKYQGNEHENETTKPKQGKKKIGSSEKATAGQSPSGMQVKFEEQMAQATPQSESSNQVEAAECARNGQGKPGETSSTPEITEVAKESISDKCEGLKSNQMIENLIRNHYLMSENGSKQVDQDYGIASAAAAVWRSQPSPTRHWSEKLPQVDHNASESSSKLHPDLKENTLKAKLFEARTRGQRSRSRLKASIFPSRKE